MIHGLPWRLLAVPLLVLAGLGCGPDKEPKLKEPTGQPQLRPLVPGDRTGPEEKGLRK